jgi:ribosomal protein S18 acetylase RimI-like enzyme
MNEKQIVGYAYYVLDRPVGFIGGLYVLDVFAEGSSYRRLISSLVKAMIQVSGLERIESQVMPFNYEFRKDFKRQGFDTLPRYFLMTHGGTVRSDTIDLRGRDHFTLDSWRPEVLLSAAEVIYDSYIGSPDAVLCRDYQSRRGCIRFLRNLVESPTCGRFDPDDTRLGLDREGKLCGILLATRISPEAGMVPQLSVRRSCQGKGLGSMLLTEYIQSSPQRVSLSVSGANTRAFELYRKLGFEVEKRFHALIWTRDRAENIA